MGILKGILPAGGFIGKVAGFVDDLIVTPEERRVGEMEQYKAETERIKVTAEERKGQVAVNKAEALSKSVFVAGWRPFVGWVCGVSLAWQFAISDAVAWTLAASGNPATLPELHGGDQLLTLLLAMLGFSGMRTYEKHKGIRNK